MVAVDTVLAVLVSVLVGLVWLTAGLLGLILVLLCFPVKVSGSVEGLQLNEDAGWNEEELRYRYRCDLLLGAVRVIGTKLPGEKTAVVLWIAGFNKRLAPKDQAAHATHAGAGPGAVDGGASAGERAGRSERAHRKGAPIRRRRAGRASTTETDGGGKAQRKAGRPETKGKARRRLTVDDLRALWPDVRWLIGRMRRSLRGRGTGELVYGFPDPFFTGLTEGLRSVVRLPAALRLRPDFSQGRLDGWIRGEVRLWPIALVAAVGRFAFRNGVRRLWWPRITSRFRRVYKAA